MGVGLRLSAMERLSGVEDSSAPAVLFPIERCAGQTLAISRDERKIDNRDA